MSIVWLASYPKSGNTWVRFLLYSVLYAPPAQSLDIARKIPDIHRPLPLDPPEGERLIVKTHFACSPSHPKIGQTRRAVLITRDPRDVLFSALNYRRLSGMTPQQMSDEQYARRFIAAGGDPGFGELGFGTWRSHIESWQGQTAFPVHTVRYEDLKADPGGHLRALLAFLDIDASDEAIDRALRASSFDAMRALEIREKSRDTRSLFIGDKASHQSRTYFMNSGKTGHRLSDIAPDLEAAFNTAFADAMRAHAYA